MANLNQKIAEMTPDKLFAGLNPAPLTGAAVIAKGAAETTYVRGTVFAKSSSTGKMVILGTTAGSGETLNADCILCDDVTVGTGADVTAAAYVQGHFNIDALVTASGYTWTQTDKDKLRERGIYLGANLD